MNKREEHKLDSAQLRKYRRALGLAPPYVAQSKGLEYVKNSELLSIGTSTLWSTRVKRARVRLLHECKSAREDEPIHKVLYDEHQRPRTWNGRNLPGSSPKRGTWLQTATANEAEA